MAKLKILAALNIESVSRPKYSWNRILLGAVNRVITILPDAVLAWIGGAGRGLDYKDLMDAEKSHDVFVGGLTQKANSAQQRPSQRQQPGNGQGKGKPTGSGGTGAAAAGGGTAADGGVTPP